MVMCKIGFVKAGISDHEGRQVIIEVRYVGMGKGRWCPCKRKGSADESAGHGVGQECCESIKADEEAVIENLLTLELLCIHLRCSHRWDAHPLVHHVRQHRTLPVGHDARSRERLLMDGFLTETGTRLACKGACVMRLLGWLKDRLAGVSSGKVLLSERAGPRSHRRTGLMQTVRHGTEQVMSAGVRVHSRQVSSTQLMGQEVDVCRVCIAQRVREALASC